MLYLKNDNMNEFDPFNSNSNNKSSVSYKGYGLKKENDIPKTIKKFIPIIIIVLILLFLIKFIFFNSALVSFSVKNTEGKTINNAKIIIGKDLSLKDRVATIGPDEEIKLRKGKYYYKIRASEYAPKPIDSFELKDDYSENVVLQKNINLEVTSIIFPKKIFPGQQVIARIEVTNLSPIEPYDFNYLVFEDSVKDWDYDILNSVDEVVSSSNIKFLPKKSTTVKIRFKVPSDIKEKSKLKINARIKYKKKKSSTAEEFDIVKEPQINVKIDISGELKSGESKTFKYTIDNKRNKISLNDITFSLDVNAENNENVEDWFNIPLDPIFIDSKQKKEDLITVNVPITAVNDTITGNLIVNSSAFSEPKLFPIELTIKEPEVNFESSLEKDKVNLIYDINANITNEEYIYLILNNKSETNIDIDSIRLENFSGRNDCNNLVFIPPNYRTRIPPKDKDEIPLHIMAIDGSLVGDLTNNSRVCQILTKIKHPYRIGEYIEKVENITIYIS